MKLRIVNLAVGLALIAPAAFAQSTEMCDRGIRGYFRCSCNVCVADARPALSIHSMCAPACVAKAQREKVASDLAKIEKRQRRVERVQGVLEALQQIQEAGRNANSSTTDDEDD